MTETELDLIKSDFRNFLFICWEHLGLPEPTPEQYDLAYYLQHGPKRKMIMAFRGVGKSWIYGAFSCWRLLNNPDWKIVCVSASKLAADALAQFVKRLIDEMPVLQHLRPDPRRNQRDSVNIFDVGPSRTSKDPSFKSVGITGQITGSRADETIADDIESANNSATQVAREYLLNAIKEFAAISKPETGLITYLGTPQSEMSIYNELPGRGYEIRVWPARVPANPEKYNGRLAPFILDMIARGVPAGTPVSPRFGEQTLIDAEGEYGRSGFQLQFMLDTSLADADRYPLKLSDLMVTPLDPRMAPVRFSWASDPRYVYEGLPCVGLSGDRYYRPMWMAQEQAEFTGCVMTIDPSGMGKDETAYAVVKQLHGYLFLVASGGYKDGFGQETLEGLAMIAKQHRAQFIRIEQNYGGGMFASLLRPVLGRIWPCTVEEERSTGQKERRIADVLEPVLNQHRLLVDAKVIEDEKNDDAHRQLMHQLTRLTRDRGSLKHDDRLDALAMAVAYWVESMARDSTKAEEEHKEAMRELALKQFAEQFQQARGGGSSVWVSV